MFLGGVLGDSTGDVLKESSETEVMESRIHVLLVDDDTLARHVVSKALEKFGYQGVILLRNGSRDTPSFCFGNSAFD